MHFKPTQRNPRYQVMTTSILQNNNSHPHTVAFIVTTTKAWVEKLGLQKQIKKISPPATYYKAITMHLSNSQPLIHFLFTAREALYKRRKTHKHRTSLSKFIKIRPRRDLKTCFPSSYLAVQFLFFLFS